MTVILFILGLGVALILAAAIAHVVRDCTKPLPGHRRRGGWRAY